MYIILSILFIYLKEGILFMRPSISACGISSSQTRFQPRDRETTQTQPRITSHQPSFLLQPASIRRPNIIHRSPSCHSIISEHDASSTYVICLSLTRSLANQPRRHGDVAVRIICLLRYSTRASLRGGEPVRARFIFLSKIAKLRVRIFGFAERVGGLYGRTRGLNFGRCEGVFVAWRWWWFSFFGRLMYGVGIWRSSGGKGIL